MPYPKHLEDAALPMPPKIVAAALRALRALRHDRLPPAVARRRHGQGHAARVARASRRRGEAGRRHRGGRHDQGGDRRRVLARRHRRGTARRAGRRDSGRHRDGRPAGTRRNAGTGEGADRGAARSARSRGSPVGSRARTAAAPRRPQPDGSRRLAGGAQAGRGTRCRRRLHRGTGPGGAITLADVEARGAPGPRRRAAAKRCGRRSPPRWPAASARFRTTTWRKTSRSLSPTAYLAECNAGRSVTERLLLAPLLVQAVARAVRALPGVQRLLPGRRVRVRARACTAASRSRCAAAASWPRPCTTCRAGTSHAEPRTARSRAARARRLAESSELADPTITVTSLGEQGVERVSDHLSAAGGDRRLRPGDRAAVDRRRRGPARRS